VGAAARAKAGRAAIAASPERPGNPATQIQQGSLTADSAPDRLAGSVWAAGTRTRHLGRTRTAVMIGNVVTHAFESSHAELDVLCTGHRAM
jgi:hypothetical protein